MMDDHQEKSAPAGSETRNALPTISGASDNGTDEEICINYDARDMTRMGKKQEFKREFDWISSLGFTSITMGS